MGRWKVWFVLLLPLTFYTDSKDTKQLLAKTIGSKPDVTPVCTNETQNPIVLITCKIRTERNWSEECNLRYRHGRDYDRKCDSRFTLMKENQTVFLHLTGLTPVDSGNHSCQCSYSFGINIVHLNITVEEDEDSTSTTEMPYLYILIGVCAFIITGVILGAILGVIHRKTRHGRQLEPLPDRLNTEPGNTEPYMTYIQRENELYSANMYSYISANNSNVFT